MFKSITSFTVALPLAAALVALPLADSRQESSDKTARQIMDEMITPASDAVFGLADPPKDAAEWAAVQESVATLADAGGLLAADRVRRDDATWKTEVAAYRDVVTAARAAVTSKNFDALTGASDKLANTCITCHATFLKK